MDMMELMRQRHSVRKYTEEPVALELREKLEERIAKINERSGLHIQAVWDEEQAFKGMMPHYGGFRGVRNYLVLAGPKGKDLQEKVGFFGEELVLYAQSLGLRTCWVALTFRKGKTRYELAPGEKMAVVISIGYGEDDGKPHKGKALNELAELNSDTPEWFLRGVEAASLAPTAVNQQKFHLRLMDNGNVQIRNLGGFYSSMDLGIVKYHFRAVTREEAYQFE